MGIVRVDTAPLVVETRTAIDDCRLAGAHGVSAGREFPLGQRRGPVALAEDKFYPRIINPSISLQLQQPADDKGEHRGRYRTARCANPFGAG